MSNGGSAGASGTDGSDEIGVLDGDSSEEMGKTAVLKRCIGESHVDRTSRLSSCATGMLGTALSVGGALALLTHTPVLLPGTLPTLIQTDVGFFAGFGVFVTGLSVLGRRRLVERLLEIGGRLRDRLFGGKDN